MADIVCPQCGRNVLGVATRCPHCGEAFPPQLLQHPGSTSRSPATRLALLLAGVGLVVGLMLLARRSGTGAGGTALPRAAAEATAPALPAPETVQAPAADSSAAPGVPTTPAVGSRPPPVPPAGLRRFARTWVNVRSGRSGSAPGLRVLGPGETVLVDSLRRGWYRVLVDGRPRGYVDRTYLDTVPPIDRP